VEQRASKQVLTAGEIAAAAGVSIETVHQARRAGELTARQVGRMWLFDAADAGRWVRARLEELAAKAGRMTTPRTRRRA
jgi:phage terminase Nu1 subunit (DNA packaging protein)